MLEMNGGDVWTLAESYLGLRHGPMSGIRPDTLLVAFLSSDPLVRAYELDLLRELDRKALGARRVVVGAGIPPERRRPPRRAPARLRDRAAVRRRGPDAARRRDGQLVAFFRCLDAGYRPDSPSQQSVITRVVSGFEIHRRNGAQVRA